MTDLTTAELNELRASLHAKVAKEPDEFMRSHISNLAETIENYLDATPERRETLRRQTEAALVRLEKFRTRQR